MIDLDAVLKVVLFCGGRGSTSIVRELLRWPNIHLTLIVNAYDDGLSTGALRELIPGMLGPSDFRKNFSYLLDLHSKEQYALKNLFEYRVPHSVTEKDIINFQWGIESGHFAQLFSPLDYLFLQLDAAVLQQVQLLLKKFFHFSSSSQKNFDFRDCAIGNLIFAGAYLAQEKNFNATIALIGQLVHSQITLVNVSHGENRFLMGLKEDGEILVNEAHIVGPQSKTPIRNVFFLPELITDLKDFANFTVDEKENWLKNQEKIPQPSPEAIAALKAAQIIIYGPGTQYSSLLPSYRIIAHELQKSAAVKIFIMNLEPDHDIQSLSANDVIDRALMYMGDAENHQQVITHILADSSLKSGLPSLQYVNGSYKEAQVIHKPYANHYRQAIHNGNAIVADVLNIYQQWAYRKTGYAPIDIFMDMSKRSLATTALLDEFLEIDWQKKFSKTVLTINAEKLAAFNAPHVRVVNGHYRGTFSDILFLSQWLQYEESEYLVLLTGDGEYRFRDVLLGIDLLEKSQFGVLLGSRTQSRRQFKASLKAAYGENHVLHFLSFLGAFLVSFLFSLRYGVIFSDPLTGFRIYRRSRMKHLTKKILNKRWMTPIRLTKYLIRHGVEIAELPVCYRTFSGFTDPHWRITRGIKNLLSIFL